MEWRVLYVKSRAEKKVAERLSNKGFETFCPLKTEIRQWSDRKKKVEVPYFASYVFVRLGIKEELQVLQTPGAVMWLRWLGKPAVIQKTEMQQVQKFFKEYEAKEVEVLRYVPGEQVNVQQGAFKGKQGVVLYQTKHTVQLELVHLQMGFKVEIAKQHLTSL